MVTPELIQFVKSELSKGTVRESIVSRLKTGGWADTDIEEVFNAINPPQQAINTNFASVSTPIDFSAVDQSASKKKLVKIALFAGLPVIILGSVFAYASGYFASLDKEFSKALQSSRDTKGSTFVMHMSLDASGMKSNSDINSELGIGDLTTIDLSGSYDATDPNYLKSSTLFGFKSGEIEGKFDLRTTDGSMYINMLKAPNLGFFSLKPFENKWIVFTLDAKSGDINPNLLLSQVGVSDPYIGTLTDAQKQKIYDITKNASFITITKKHLPSFVDGALSFHFDFDLNKPGILAYIREIEAYMKTISPKDEGMMMEITDDEFNKEFSYIKNFHGEAWVGVFDHLPHKLATSFEFVDISGTQDGPMKVSMSIESKDWNKKLNVEVPKDTTTIEKLMKSVMGDMGMEPPEADSVPSIYTGDDPLSNARRKGSDEKIESILSFMRANGEIYYEMNNNSYKGFCRDKVNGANKPDLALSLPKNTVYKCNDSSTAWAAWAKISNGSYWCSDSTGSSIEVSYGSGTPTSTSCRQ